jgi:hypothetical protein
VFDGVKMSIAEHFVKYNVVARAHMFIF